MTLSVLFPILFLIDPGMESAFFHSSTRCQQYCQQYCWVGAHNPTIPFFCLVTANSVLFRKYEKVNCIIFAPLCMALHTIALKYICYLMALLLVQRDTLGAQDYDLPLFSCKKPGRLVIEHFLFALEKREGRNKGYLSPLVYAVAQAAHASAQQL